jgi:PPM family protein phosphatase
MPKTFLAFKNQPESREGPSFFVADAQGPRDEQQDASTHLSSPALGTALLVVSDGVGGNSGGRIASQTVVESARELWKERNGRFEDPSADLDTLCRSAHREMNQRGAKRGISPRATVVALYLTPSQAFWVHSGDSRLYHFRSGKLLKRTEDDSVVEVMVKQGMLSEEEMGEHPDQGRLLRSLGGEDYRSPTKGTTKLTSRDAFLLCTDGFWERTKVDEMSELLFGPPSTAAARLNQAVDRAVKRNGPKGDNVTAIVALPSPGADTEGVLPSNRWLIPALVTLSLLIALSVVFWPTKKEDQNGSPSPVATPTVPPSISPTVPPSATPTVAPSATPTVAPSTTPARPPASTPAPPPLLALPPPEPPGSAPAVSPVSTPTVKPAGTPTAAPTGAPTATPAATPSVTPAKSEDSGGQSAPGATPPAGSKGVTVSPKPSQASPPPSAEKDEGDLYKRIKSISIDGKISGEER